MVRSRYPETARRKVINLITKDQEARSVDVTVRSGQLELPVSLEIDR